MESDLKTKTAALRRQHILEAAIRVFDANGFRGATIRQVALEAGVSDGTIYNVFESKEALLLAILEPLLTASGPAGVLEPPLSGDGLDVESLLHGMITARWSSLTPEALSMMRVVWSEALVNRKLAGLYNEEVTRPAFDAPEPLFQQLNKSGAIATRDVPLTLRILAASFMGLALLKMLGDPLVNEQSEEIAGSLADLILHGLLPRHGTGGGHGAD